MCVVILELSIKRQVIIMIVQACKSLNVQVMPIMITYNMHVYTMVIMTWCVCVTAWCLDPQLMEADEESRMEEGAEEPVFSASSSSSTTQLKELISKPKSRPRKKYKWTKETKCVLAACSNVQCSVKECVLCIQVHTHVRI